MNFGNLLARNVRPEIIGLARYVTELAGDERLPRRSRFNPSCVRAVRDYIYLIKILRDEHDYFYDSLQGRRMPVLFGCDMEGKRLSELKDADQRMALRRTYDRVVATEQPLFLRARYRWPHRKSIAIERLLIPMASDDGVLSAICGISIPEVPDIDLEMYAGQGPAHLVSEEECMLLAG